MRSEGPKLWLCMYRNPLGEDSMNPFGEKSMVQKEVTGGQTSVSATVFSSPLPLSYAAIGSTIYVVGGPGRPVGSPDVYGYSTTSPQGGCFRLPSSMSVGRSRPLTAVLDNKLYVFGGLNMSSPEPWAEVFDPDSQLWRPLPPLDLLCASARSAVAAVVCHAHNIILLLNPRNRMLYIFSALLNSWKLFDDVPEDVYFPCEQPVMVNETMYYCSGQHLHAYHIYRRDCLSTQIVGLDMGLDFEEEHVIQSQSLIHLGGDTFSLVWLHEHSVRCTRFRASIHTSSDDGKGTLMASVESEESFLVGDNHEDLEFGGALLLDHGWRSGGTSEIILTGDKPHTEGSRVEGN